ncbi:hypothetical protein NHJ13051_007205 [Beauveria bassiana]
MRKRLKDKQRREVTERKQVGDAEAVLNAPPGNYNHGEDRQL